MRETTRFGFFIFFFAQQETTVGVKFFQDPNDIRKRAVTDQTQGTWTLSESFKQWHNQVQFKLWLNEARC